MSHRATKHDVMPLDFVRRKLRLRLMNEGLARGNKLLLGVALSSWTPFAQANRKLIQPWAVNRGWCRSKQMPTLRSSSNARQTAQLRAGAKQHSYETQAEAVVSEPVTQSQASAGQNSKRSANRKRKRAVHQADNANVSQAEAVPVAAVSIAVDQPTQQTSAPAKKVKARKALLSTLWTEADLVPLRAKAEQLFDQLNELYVDPPCPLNYDSPFQLLVAVILSAQTTDKKVNEVTPALFKLAADAKAMANMEAAQVQELIRQVGLAPTKARNIVNMSKMLMEEHGGTVPQSFEELEQLPGVGHKTASVVICTAFGTPTFPVDTHIHRLAQRWGLTKGKTVEQTEADLKVLLPEAKWNNYHLRFIYFGREHCPAQRHDPSQCQICSWAAVPPFDKVGTSPKKT